ncbi:MAG: hypothetical protein EBU54_03935, partial [Mycobacteriaceae bacterium]|nr:hypothetical protein [Mycobacteriaceae bacterium]
LAAAARGAATVSAAGLARDPGPRDGDADWPRDGPTAAVAFEPLSATSDAEASAGASESSAWAVGMAAIAAPTPRPSANNPTRATNCEPENDMEPS